MAHDGLLLFVWISLDVDLRAIDALACNLVVLQLLVFVLLLELLPCLLHEEQKEEEGR